jgi:hypothetical protein
MSSPEEYDPVAFLELLEVGKQMKQTHGPRKMLKRSTDSVVKRGEYITSGGKRVRI